MTTTQRFCYGILLFALCASAWTVKTALAAVPPIISYQGYLTDASGAPIDDNLLVTFAIYDMPQTGVPLWSEAQLVTFEAGLFSVTLGQDVPLPAGLADAPRYIGVTVNLDPEMFPRRQITSTMFALASEDAALLDGAPASTYNQSGHVTDASNPHNVSASQVGAATQGDLTTHTSDASAHHARYSDGESLSAVLAADGPGSGLDADTLDGISSESLLQASGDFGRPGVSATLFEGSSSLSSLYVNEGQVNSVTSAMIATNAVGSSEIATNAVGVLEIASNAVGADELNFSINATESDLNGGLVSMTNTANGSVSNVPAGLMGQATGAPGANRVIGVAGLAPGLGTISLNNIPLGVKIGVVGAVDVGVGVAASSGTGIGVQAYGSTMATKGVGINGPTNGYAGVQGTLNFDGDASVDISGFEIGLLGVSNGATVSDNYGVYGYSNNVGVFGVGTRLAGEFIGDVKIGQKGEMTLTGSQLTMETDTGVPTIVIDANAGPSGRIKAGEFAVTGGSDLSEKFNVDNAGGSAAVEPGMVVSIDPSHAGQLMISAQAYDRKVAGIISGAGGVRAGVVMGQEGSIADGDYPVALTGRVYVKADAAFGPIQPGDLLTTSPRPGYAMRVSDHSRAPGAIIGKAMTGLDVQTGLVLVLVTLQ